MASDDGLNDSARMAEEIGETLTLSAGSFSRALRRGMRDAVVEGHGLERVLQRAARSLSTSALSAGLRPLTTLMGRSANDLMTGLTRSLTKGFGGTKAVPFAKGGVIGSPTGFAMGGGRVGLMGEAGREAVLPLARGTDGRLGVALEGGGAAAPSVTFNVVAQDAESFRRSETQITAMLARAVARGRRGL
ncbi:MAG: phage tail tape measure protein [Acuticoccus sp.]